MLYQSTLLPAARLYIANTSSSIVIWFWSWTIKFFSFPWHSLPGIFLTPFLQLSLNISWNSPVNVVVGLSPCRVENTLATSVHFLSRVFTFTTAIWSYSLTFVCKSKSAPLLFCFHFLSIWIHTSTSWYGLTWHVSLLTQLTFTLLMFLENHTSGLSERWGWSSEHTSFYVFRLALLREACQALSHRCSPCWRFLDRWPLQWRLMWNQCWTLGPCPFLPKTLIPL